MEKSEFVIKWESHPIFNQEYEDFDFDYSLIDQRVKGLDLIKFSPDEYLYVLDIYTKKFAYYHAHKYFLGDKTVEFVNSEGYMHFVDRISPADYEKVIYILDLVWETHFPVAQQNVIISYNINVKIDEHLQMLTLHRIKIIETDASGKSWLVLFSSSRTRAENNNKVTVSDTEQGEIAVYDAKTRNVIDDRIDNLSDRELEVLRFIYQGLTVKEIANQLFLSINTVKFHKKNIFSKTNCRNSIELFQYGMKHNLINS